MKAKRVLIVFLMILIVVIFLACGETSDFLTRNGSNRNSNSGSNSNEALTDNGEPENGSEQTSDNNADEEGNAEESGFGGAEGDVPLIIKIINSRIILDGDDISLNELEDLLLLYIDSEYVWELHDTHQAVKSVYDDIVELFNKYNVIYREKQD